jgi:hypothetical protein
MKYYVAFTSIIFLLMVSCTPSESSLATAIAQTQSAWTPTFTISPTITNTMLPTRTNTDVPTPTITPIPMKLAYEDDFETDNVSYDPNNWVCRYGDCSISKIFQRDGALHWKYSAAYTGGGAEIRSTRAWKTSKIISLECKIKISSFTGSGGGFGLVDGAAINVRAQTKTDLVIVGNYGKTENIEYVTNPISAKFDTWYSLSILFDAKAQEYRYLVDGKIIGKYSPNTLPSESKIMLGVWNSLGQAMPLEVLMDEIKLFIQP